MHLDQPSAIEGPQEPRAAKVIEGTGGSAAEQVTKVPAQGRGASSQVPVGRQEVLAVIHELPPAMLGDIRWWALAIEARNPFEPMQRDAMALQLEGCVLRFYCGERHVIAFRTRYGGLSRG